MDLFTAANIFNKLATINDNRLDPYTASNILKAFHNISKKQYNSVTDIEYDVVSALSPIEIENPNFVDGDAGFKSKIYYPHGQPQPIQNAQIGIAWKRFDNFYRAQAHILDLSGLHKINDPKDLLITKTSPKPKYWPGEGERFTKDPDRE